MIKEKLQTNIAYPEVKLKDVLRAFWHGIKPQKWGLFFLALSIILANIAGIISPIFYKSSFFISFLGYF